MEKHADTTATPANATTTYHTYLPHGQRKTMKEGEYIYLDATAAVDAKAASTAVVIWALISGNESKSLVERTSMRARMPFEGIPATRAACVALGGRSIESLFFRIVV